MNFKALLTSLGFMLLLLGCNSQDEPLIDLKQELIQALLNSPEAQSSKNQGKVVILKDVYCKTFDCEEYFRDYKDDIQFYTREGAFMRRIANSLTIQTMDDEKGFIIISKRIKGKVEESEIKL